MKKSFILPLFILLTIISFAQQKSPVQRADSLLKLMTLEEKIGQLHQLSGDWVATGPITPDGDKQGQIRRGQMGSMLNITGVEHTRQLQQIAMQSRLKIPLLFGQDIIHGYRTIFPIPLGEAASWDLSAIEKSARYAAVEASSQGVHWTFAPMVDIARDPRWGRIMEGAGEDTYYGSLVAAARVKGFQGKGLGNTDALMACAKHFAAYGAAIGGRDYNSVDMSERQLYEVYLPPFKAAADAGVATFMNSFNDINGIPATANKLIQTTILKQKWNYKGFVVSDWGSIGEMINHGYSKDLKEAAMQAMLAGNDMDMESRAYQDHLAGLIKEKKVPIAYVDAAVKRILIKKFELGLFENPYKFCDEARQEKYKNYQPHLSFARELGAKSIVLLKNDTVQGMSVLPLQANKKIALIGPLVKEQRENIGFWSYTWDDDSARIVSLWQGMKQKANGGLFYAKGCDIVSEDTSGFIEARNIAQQADIIVMQIGEKGDMSGEAKSRHNIHLPGVQEALVQEMVKMGKPVIVLISAGRPLVFGNIANKASAVLYTWWLGTEAGNAMADVLYGAENGGVNPSGKLPVTFPRDEGQIPIYYNYYNTGRPAKDENDRNYVSAYIDLPNSPAYPFGFGLSYAKFNYGKLLLSKTKLSGTENLVATIEISNTSNVGSEEVVQLYIRDLVGKVVRPVKELKGFQKIYFAAGETKKVQFVISTEMLKFYDKDLKYDWEPGEFEIMIGTNSRDVQSARVVWNK